MLAKSALRHTVAGLLFLTVSSASAQEFPKEHLASAKAAIEASHMWDSIDTLLLGMALQTKSMLTKNNPSLGPQIDEVTNKVAIELAARRPELDKQLQSLWATKFTKPELDELTKFMTSPVGKKWVTELSKTIQSSGQVIQAWQTKVSEEMLAKVREEMKKRGAPL